jgi:hypothetical protein
VLEPDGTLSAQRKDVEVHTLAELSHPDPTGRRVEGPAR